MLSDNGKPIAAKCSFKNSELNVMKAAESQ